MGQAKNRYKMRIGEHTYTIIGPESKAHMSMVEELVNSQLSDLRRIAPNTPEEQAAILLAVNAVSDQVKKQKELLELKKECVKLQNRVELLKDAEEKLKKIENVENKAKQALKKDGKEIEPENHIEAQQIINEQAKQTIENTKTRRSKS